MRGCEGVGVGEERVYSEYSARHSIVQLTSRASRLLSSLLVRIGIDKRANQAVVR